MSTELTHQDESKIMEAVIAAGDLSKMTSAQRNDYYMATCKSVGLNPLTRPFEYITLNGKMVLYTRKDATDQLRAIHGIEIYKMEKESVDGLFVVTAYAKNSSGRTDIDMGFANIKGLQGEALGNAMLKGITKAKRRVTLSLVGLGMLDESEVADIHPKDITPHTSEMVNIQDKSASPSIGWKFIGDNDMMTESLNDEEACLYILERLNHISQPEDMERYNIWKLNNKLTLSLFNKQHPEHSAQLGAAMKQAQQRIINHEEINV